MALGALRGASRSMEDVGVGYVHPQRTSSVRRPQTNSSRRRLYLLARVVVARHYRMELTLAMVAGAIASSPRQVQRAYEQFGETTFREDLRGRRMAAAADLLAEQRSIPVGDVARLVGYRQTQHFARAFRRRYGVSPAGFRERGIHAGE